MSTVQLTASDENYWRLVKILLEDAPSKLRELFRLSFLNKYRVTWGDNSTSGKFFMGMVPKSKKRDQHITDKVELGTTANFDSTTLFYCLLFCGTDLLLPGARKKELRGSPFHQSERVDQLREQRNALAHATTPSVSQADFRARIQEIEEIYQDLQWDQTKLKQAAYDQLWPMEYERLRQKIELEKTRIDSHEQRLQNLDQQQQNHEQRLQHLEQRQQDQETFVKTVEGMSSELINISGLFLSRY